MISDRRKAKALTNRLMRLGFGDQGVTIRKMISGGWKIKVFQSGNYNEIHLKTLDLSLEERMWLYFKVCWIVFRLSERIFDPMSLIVMSKLAVPQIETIERLKKENFIANSFEVQPFHF